MNEKVDIFSLGTMYYTILTGRWISEDQINAEAEYGGKLYVDDLYLTKSIEEARLAELVNRCKEPNPDDRPSVFEIVEALKDAQKQSAKLKQSN
jgi:serine/threonine protein kinase